MKNFLKRWVVNTLAVLVAVYIVPGIHFKDQSYWTPFVVALVLGVLNVIVRPILMYLALPLLIVTLGLFTLVINALLLYLVSYLLGSHFQVDSFWSAFWGALIISLVSGVLNVITGVNRSRVQVVHGRPRPNDNGGPVIDV